MWLRYFGKPVNIVKVFCQNPNVIAKYAKAMAKIPGVTESLEEDIRYSTRYLMDNNVSPCSWHEIEVEEEKYTGGIQVDNLYTAKSPPKISERPPDYFYAKSTREFLIAYRICRPEDCFEQGILGLGAALLGRERKEMCLLL